MVSRLRPYFPVLFFCIMDYFLAHVDEFWNQSHTRDMIFFSCMWLRMLHWGIAISILSYRVLRIEKHSIVFLIGYFVFALYELGRFVLIQL